jgi:hypothetical protein
MRSQYKISGSREGRNGGGPKKSRWSPAPPASPRRIYASQLVQQLSSRWPALRARPGKSPRLFKKAPTSKKRLQPFCGALYTGAAPNQQAIPAVDYLMKDAGVKRWVLEGTDYVLSAHHQ